jgi:hypothetical protein
MVVKSGYVLAGFETLLSLTEDFLAGGKGVFANHFTPQQLNVLLRDTVSGYLHSFGQNIERKKSMVRHKKNETALYKMFKELPTFQNCTSIVDSGGFQISIGRLTRAQSEMLINLYYEWVGENIDLLDRAFILDVPPGPGCKVFKNFYDVYKLNLESYQRAKALPEEIRKKIIYIHHFRTPKLWEIYTSIMRDYEMFNSFEYHGTGGIVANMSGDMSIPCIIYVLPLIPLLNECKKYNRNYLNFHILGGANFRDILFYELFRVVVKDKHNIDLNITYDSSGIYKQIYHARYLHAYAEHDFIRKLNIKSDSMKERFFQNWSGEEYLQKLMNDFSDKWNFKRINVASGYGLYPDGNGKITETLHPDLKVYMAYYTLDLFSTIQQNMREWVESAYPTYQCGAMEEFHKKCFDITRIINQGKMTKKQIIKADSIAKSLDMLTNLDEDYCHYLVDKFLAKDEFKELDDRTSVMNI